MLFVLDSWSSETVNPVSGSYVRELKLRMPALPLASNLHNCQQQSGNRSRSKIVLVPVKIKSLMGWNKVPKGLLTLKGPKALESTIGPQRA